MVASNQENFNNEELDDILRKHFTNNFRFGYVTIDGTTMPKRFEDLHEQILNFEVNEDDVWICSFPKTGTTWTQEMVWMIMHDLDFEGGQVNLGQRSPFLEVSAIYDFRNLMRNNKDFVPPPFLQDSLKFVKEQENPACIKTHLPFHLLPLDIQSGRKNPKIIYVARNPKDTCVSYYHHSRALEGYTGTFDDFVRLFLAGKLNFAPYWDHVLRYWEKREQSNVLFVKYEDMKLDLPGVIRKVASFLGKNLSAEQVAALSNHLSFENMKNNPAVNYEMVTELNKKFNLTRHHGAFMRSGTIGGYKSQMTPEIVDRFDKWTEFHTGNTDFSF
ncbi:luciferin sulfotransferase-like [Cylas formicarius]|uniref:luciferin sulfotransferase-like n=1 Tax=Cylas formicarius TaxID=197179 RepID=UPI002958B117|nr:luciferin sulfotransferase-like [Cylas formicarius]